MKHTTDEVKKKMQLNSDFWENYRKTVISQGIPKAKADWYMKWARKFAVSIRGVSLRSRVEKHERLFFLICRNKQEFKNGNCSRPRTHYAFFMRSF